jgi:hypothetical protein
LSWAGGTASGYVGHSSTTQVLSGCALIQELTNRFLIE